MTITWKGSPNFDSNRKKIDRVVIHWIVGNLAVADSTFQKLNGTSAHYGIEDNEVHQYVKEDKVAYHAGNYAMNQRSIGIEHSAAPDRPASETTYKTSGELVKAICQRYGIPLDRQHILRHSEVVATQCCGTVDINKIISLAQGSQPTPPMDPNIQRKASYFDRIWHAREGDQVDTNLVTDQQVIDFISRMLRERDRAGKFDQVGLKGGLTGDSNQWTVDQVFNAIKALGGSGITQAQKDQIKSYVQNL